MAKSKPVVIEENWEVYSYGTEEGPVFVTFYAGASELEQSEYPFCARVIIPIKSPNENGGPQDAEAEYLWKIEDQLAALLTKHRAPCILLARLTHGGTRELVFQVADWEKFRPPVGLWLEQITDYEVDVSEHDGWEFFESCVWPSDEDWMLIQDRHVVEGLLEAGSNPEKEHSLDFSFRGGAAELKRLRTQLKTRGFVEDESSNEPGQLVMIRKLPLDLHRIQEETLEVRRLCEKLDVEFDGWGAGVEE